jgi:hypothetical protein
MASDMGAQMHGLPFDVDHPPDEPPPGVVQVMLWRVSIRVHRDHDVVVRTQAGAMVCDLCRQPWPCRPRRLAQRALIAAFRPATQVDGPTGYVDRWLATDIDPPER